MSNNCKLYHLKDSASIGFKDKRVIKPSSLIPNSIGVVRITIGTAVKKEPFDYLKDIYKIFRIPHSKINVTFQLLMLDLL